MDRQFWDAALSSFIVVVFILGAVYAVVSVWPTEEEMRQEQEKTLARIASFPTEDMLFEDIKKCSEAGLSVVEEREFIRHHGSFVSNVRCGVPLAQKAAEEQARSNESEVAEAAAIAGGAYLIGKFLLE